jgi:pimeloyl-ACP methyl ester carboxylesterase
VTPALERLVARGVVRHGAFLEGAPDQYVHVAVLDEVQRRQVHARRVPRPVATAEQFAAFLLRRHHLHPEHRLVGPPGLLAALELLQGEDFPVRVWEQDLLPARVEDYRREWLDQLGLSGEIVWTVFEPPPRAPGESEGGVAPFGQTGETAVAARVAQTWAMGVTGKFIWPLPDKGLRRRVHRVTAPTLLLWGKDDRVVPPVYADEFTRRIPGARLQVVDGAGHAPHLEQPQAVARTVRDFLTARA